jgi:hypothetical protein
MSAGGDEPGRDQDPWSQPADSGQPGWAAPQPAPPEPQPGRGDYPSAPPDSWSAPPPAAWGHPAQQDQPAPGGYWSPQAGSPDQAAAQSASTNGLPPDGNGGYRPATADPRATSSAGGYPPPAGQYPPPADQYPPPAGQYGYQQPPYYPAAAVPRNNPVAIAALVCGLAQFVLGLLLVGNILLAIPAIICGAIGLRQIDQRGERGRGMAIAGLVLGILGVVYFVIIVGLIIVGLNVHST